MAGFDRIYCLGHEGGFMGADGLNTIDLEILHGISDREWYEARPSKGFALTGDIRFFVPSGPDDPDALLDAFLILAPGLFQDQRELDEMIKTFGKSGAERVDFNHDGVPDGWRRIRDQARPTFKELAIYMAELVPVNR